MFYSAGIFLGLQTQEATSQVKEFALFYIWEDARVWAHWNQSFDMHHSYLGPVSCFFTSWVSLGLTIGSGCSLMAARWQVFFSFLSSLRVHQLTLEGCNCWWLTWQEIFHFSNPLLLVRNLTNILETFHDQILSHGTRRLILDQAKILDMPLEVLIFGLGSTDN